MNLSCCVWALSGPEEDMLASLADVGFTWIDVRPLDLTRESSQARVRELALRVSCIGASFGLPEGVTLDSTDDQINGEALDHIEKALAHGAKLGALAAYVVPGLDPGREALAGYARSLVAAADKAAALGLKLCIEHFPGRALPTATVTLDFIQEIGHPNLYLLFDIGHIQISGEDPAAIIEAAGARLGYVHLDDNNGRDDQHLSLLDGVLTETTLRRTLAALKKIGYNGAISLELNPNLPDPLKALKQSREVVYRCLPKN
jgi:sugar phosphate isomerase/epimerase